MPREQTVTVTTVSEVTIKNGIFTSFDDAHTCCSLLADQEGFPKLTKGNAQRNKKTNAECPRLMCSKCKSQFMSFKRITNNAGNPEYRLLTCSSLEDYLKHSCPLTDHTPQRYLHNELIIKTFVVVLTIVVPSSLQYYYGCYDECPVRWPYCDKFPL